MASLETTRGRQVPAWQQANRYYQQPTDYVAEMQPRSQSATAPATRKRRSTNGSYKIQKGDTLSAIAKRYGTTVQAIAEANNIADVNKIYVGDSLNIPGNATARTTNAPTQRTNTSSATTNQNMRARQNRIDTAIAVSKVPRTLSVNRNSQESTNNTNTNTQYTSTYQITPEMEEGERGLRQLNAYQAQRRIDLAQQVGRVPKQLSTTSSINNGFSKSDIAAIRQDQSRRPAVVYNTRSKPSLRRNQRYSRTGDTRAIRYNKNRPRTWNDYKNQKAGWIRELYG